MRPLRLSPARSTFYKEPDDEISHGTRPNFRTRLGYQIDVWMLHFPAVFFDSADVPRFDRHLADYYRSARFRRLGKFAGRFE